jgi:hypothetical protein
MLMPLFFVLEKMLTPKVRVILQSLHYLMSNAVGTSRYNDGKPVILVLTEGRPRFITSIEPSMKGILWLTGVVKKPQKQLQMYCSVITT